jgi:hypothetical protein
MAAALIIQSILAAKISHAEHAAEAFTWVTSALLAGVGIGLAAGRALGARFPLGGELLVHTAAARFQRGGQARAQLAEELVVRT